MGVTGSGKVVNPIIHIEPIDCECNEFVHKTEEDKPITSVCPNCKRRYTIVNERGRAWLQHSGKTYEFGLKSDQDVDEETAELLKRMLIDGNED